MEDKRKRRQRSSKCRRSFQGKDREETISSSLRPHTLAASGLIHQRPTLEDREETISRRDKEDRLSYGNCFRP